MSDGQRPVKIEWVQYHHGAHMMNTQMLSLEERGLYGSICHTIYDGQIVPLDRSMAARLLRLNKLQYEKVLKKLIEKGIVSETNEGVVVQTAIRERGASVSFIVRRKADKDSATVIQFPGK